MADEEVGSIVVEAARSRTIEVVEVGSFSRDAAAILGEDEISALFQEVGTLRATGDLIKDTHGLRKLRWGARGHEKRGGARIIYYYGGDHMPMFMIAIYAKNEKADMSDAAKKAPASWSTRCAGSTRRGSSKALSSSEPIRSQTSWHAEARSLPA